MLDPPRSEEGSVSGDGSEGDGFDAENGDRQPVNDVLQAFTLQFRRSDNPRREAKSKGKGKDWMTLLPTAVEIVNKKTNRKTGLSAAKILLGIL
eukprot:SAG31_NODE_378_length_16503_cov_28.830041_5_plen_94_part_00